MYLSLSSAPGLAAERAGLFCFAAFLGLARRSKHACFQEACRWRHTTGGTAALRARAPASSGNRLPCGQVMLWVGDWLPIVFPIRLRQPLQSNWYQATSSLLFRCSICPRHPHALVPIRECANAFLPCLCTEVCSMAASLWLKEGILHLPTLHSKALGRSMHVFCRNT